MHRILSLLTIATMLYTFSACSTCDCEQQGKKTNGEDIIQSPQRTGNSSGSENANAFFITMRNKAKTLAEIERQSLSAGVLPKNVKIGDIVIDATRDRNELDAEGTSMVMTIFNSLMKAEGMENQLDLQFSMSDKAVEDGVFLFALRTPDSFKGTQQISLQMFNEEGFEMVANNQFQITPGNNYKALNVRDLTNGIYILRLSDGGSRELLRRVQIGNEVIN